MDKQAVNAALANICKDKPALKNFMKKPDNTEARKVCAAKKEVVKLKQLLSNDDYKHTRHQRELALLSAAVITEEQLSMTQADYLAFCQGQLVIIEQINSLEESI